MSKRLEGIRHYGEIYAKNLDNTLITMEAGMPILEAVDFVPTALISQNIAKAKRKNVHKPEGTVHYFVDDYRFPRVTPFLTETELKNTAITFEKEAKWLKEYEAVCSIDYSPYADWSNGRCYINTFLNHLSGAVWQSHGLIVIPTVTWSTPNTYAYCFTGLEKGGTYVVSATGCNSPEKRWRDACLKIYRDGMKEFVKRIEPMRILVHGSKEAPDADYGNAEVIFYENILSKEQNQRRKAVKQSRKEKKDV